MSKEDDERERVEIFYDLNKGKRARGHSIYNHACIIYGTIVDVDCYYLNGADHWTVVLSEYPKQMRVVFSSIQLLEAESNQVAHSRESIVVRNETNVPVGVLKQISVKHCHEECTDGYCHRAYMQGIIRASG